MVSVLIPTYNFNATNLVNEIYKQLLNNKLSFEIIVYDDGSLSHLNKKNEAINNISNCTFKAFNTNIGRSAIRNLLAINAQYDLLLFIDSGTFPESENFILKYSKLFNKSVVIGGMTCLKKKPKKHYRLRWLYTKLRESNLYKNHKKAPSICSSNFLIQKDFFMNNLFDESIKKYGYEDVLFFDALTKQGIDITYINNPVIHNADDNTNTFLKKTENAIENLIELIKTNKLDKDKSRISKTFYSLKKIKTDRFIAYCFVLSKSILKINFNSSYPSILLYDFYRLGYFCLLMNKK
ncbi:glycosyltransferase [Flavobacteriaceae bacterium AU392]|nr:glycosyltransferase family 2 protein [Flavobacteriaceae bacterium]RKM81178.1 glycosyltransferase [Flavobacteriaceae bacterium AU392]